MGSIVDLDWRCSETGYRLNRDLLHYMDQLAEVVVVVVASMLERWVAIAGHHATSRYPPLDSGLTSSGRDTAYSDCSHLLLQYELLLCYCWVSNPVWDVIEREHTIRLLCCKAMPTVEFCQLK